MPSRAKRFSGNRPNGSRNGSKWGLPTSAVRYPASRSTSATDGASPGSGTPFIQTPWVLGCWPVIIVEREGMQTTDCGWARS